MQDKRRTAKNIQVRGDYMVIPVVEKYSQIMKTFELEHQMGLQNIRK